MPHPSKLVPRSGLCVGALLSAQLFSAPVHAASFEPNDSFLQAVGPLVGGQYYDSAIDNPEDVDYFYFNVSGQRQLDIALTMVTEEPDGDTDSVEGYLYDIDGDYVSSGYVSVEEPGQTGHARLTSISSGQYAIAIKGDDVGVYGGSTYRLRVDPADAIIQTDPGLVAALGAASQTDDVQRIYVNGTLVGETRAKQAQTFSLGALPPDAPITFEAVNADGPWSWNARVTNVVGRARSTILNEQQSGGEDSLFSSSGPVPVVGAVRRVTFTPSGAIRSSCGVALAPVKCDLAPSPTPAPPAPPAAEVPFRSLTISRKAGRYRGRVSSGDRVCYRDVRIRLRRKGKGTKSYGSTVTRADGSWTIQRRALSGKVYAFAEPATVGTVDCPAASSRTLVRRSS